MATITWEQFAHQLEQGEADEAALSSASLHARAADSRRITLLHLACRHGRLQAAESLLKAGASPQAVDFEGRTPLHHVALLGHAPLVPLLTHHHALPDVVASDGSTPLFLAVQQQALPCVEALLTAGASPSQPGPQLRTPLHLACTQGHLPLVLILLGAGANPFAKDAQGRLPLSLLPVQDEVALDLTAPPSLPSPLSSSLLKLLETEGEITAGEALLLQAEGGATPLPSHVTLVRARCPALVERGGQAPCDHATLLLLREWIYGGCLRSPTLPLKTLLALLHTATALSLPPLRHHLLTLTLRALTDLNTASLLLPPLLPSLSPQERPPFALALLRRLPSWTPSAPSSPLPPAVWAELLPALTLRPPAPLPAPPIPSLPVAAAPPPRPLPTPGPPRPSVPPSMPPLKVTVQKPPVSSPRPSAPPAPAPPDWVQELRALTVSLGNLQSNHGLLDVRPVRAALEAGQIRDPASFFSQLLGQLEARLRAHPAPSDLDRLLTLKAMVEKKQVEMRTRVQVAGRPPLKRSHDVMDHAAPPAPSPPTKVARPNPPPVSDQDKAALLGKLSALGGDELFMRTVGQIISGSRRLDESSDNEVDLNLLPTPTFHKLWRLVRLWEGGERNPQRLLA